MSDKPNIADPRLEEDRYVYTKPLAADEMETMFSAIAAATLEDHPGLLGAIRQWSTPMRVGTGVGIAAVFSALVVVLIGLRGNLTETGLVSILLPLSAVAGLGIGALSLSLRGLHRRTVEGRAWGFACLVLLAPLGFSLLQGRGAGAPSVSRVMPWESGCFLLGAVVAALSGVAVLLLQRSRQLAAWRVLAAAGAGGSAGFITQSLFCPAGDTWHLVTIHGLVGLLTAALLLARQHLRQRHV